MNSLMRKSIFVLAITAAFVTGMIIQIIPADAAQKDCKKDDQRSCWIRVSQMFGISIKKLQDANKHFVNPFEGLDSPPNVNRDEIEDQLFALDALINEIQMKQTDWEFLLERAE